MGDPSSYLLDWELLPGALDWEILALTWHLWLDWEILALTWLDWEILALTWLDWEIPSSYLVGLGDQALTWLVPYPKGIGAA